METATGSRLRLIDGVAGRIRGSYRCVFVRGFQLVRANRCDSNLLEQVGIDVHDWKLFSECLNAVRRETEADHTLFVPKQTTILERDSSKLRHQRNARTGDL